MRNSQSHASLCAIPHSSFRIHHFTEFQTPSYLPFAPFRIHHSAFIILQNSKPLHIFLNRTNPANAEVFDQDFGHIR